MFYTSKMNFRKIYGEWLFPQTQTPATHISLGILGLMMMIITVGCSAVQDKDDRMVLPSDFQQAAEIDLSNRSYKEEILGQFLLEDTTDLDILFSIPNVDTTFLDLSLMGPDSVLTVILHSEDYRTDQHGSGRWKKSLTPGAYQLVLTSEQSPGTLSVFWLYR